MPDYKDVEVDGDIKRGSVIEDGRMYDVTQQDIQPYLEEAAIARSLAPQALASDKYKKTTFGCVKAASIPTSFVEKMARGQCCTEGKKYDCLANDPEEVSRAYLHLQTCHKDMLWVNGTPFAKKRSAWH